jgi:hypothetical protein
MADPLDRLALFWVRREGKGTIGWLEMMMFFIDLRRGLIQGLESIVVMLYRLGHEVSGPETRPLPSNPAVKDDA